jgi:hypothetical protein
MILCVLMRFVKLLAHRFTVQFDSYKDDYKSSFYQNTAVYDIIHYDDAVCHSIRVNDKVLALTDSKHNRYAPAEVLEGFEKRNSANPADHSKLKQWSSNCLY